MSLNKAVADLFKNLVDKFPNLFLPHHVLFTELKTIFNSYITKEDPTAIFLSQNTKDVSDLLNSNLILDQPILMRSGGHSYAGFSTGNGIVLDCRKQKKIEFKENTVLLGSGLTLKEVQDELYKKNLTFPSGQFHNVGLAGYLLGGGHSRRSRLLGLGADCVKSMSVTLASGQKIESVSATHFSDLYWAMLGGGGGNFAYVDSFEIEPSAATYDYFFKYVYPASVANNADEIFEFWEKQIQLDSKNTSVNLTLYIQNSYITKLIVSGLITDVSMDKNKMDSLFKETAWVQLEKFNPIRVESHIVHSNALSVKKAEQMYFVGASHYADHPIGLHGYQQIKESIKNYSIGSNLYMGFYPMSGQIKSPKYQISYPHRNSLYLVDMFSNFSADRSLHEHHRQNFNSLHKDINPYFSGRSYINYPNLDYDSNWAQRYYGQSLQGLLNVKKKYDPKNLFNYGQHSLSQWLMEV